MKKTAGLFLALALILSMHVVALAAEYETDVDYEGSGTIAYEVNVPAELAPGESGQVSVSGTWPSNMTVSVTAPDTVTLTNSLDGGTKSLGIAFGGIIQPGSNTESIATSAEVSVSDISDALFGTWTGSFTYDVGIFDANALSDAVSNHS